MFKNIVKLRNETERRAEFEKNKAKVCRRGGGSAPILLRLDRWLYKAAKQLGSEAAKCNILLSPLEGEKKFLSELCELRNFREGYKNIKIQITQRIAR